MCGIYKITNLINNKIYIGQSMDIHRRWRAHKSSAFNENCSIQDYPLYRAFRKYGIENFSFEILEECLSTELDEKEKEYILFYNSLTPNGYNQTLLNNTNSKLEPKEILEIKEELKTSLLSSEEIGKKYGVSGRTIRSINTGESWYDDNIDYPIRKIFTQNQKYFCSLCGKEIKTNSRYCIDCGHSVQQKCDRPDRVTLKNLIRNKTFVEIGKEYGVTDNAIKKWCDKENLPRTKKEIKSYSDEEWEQI